MSRSDRGDGHRLGGGFAVGKLGGIDALATKQSPGLFLPNADAFGASCLLHCVQFTREQAPAPPRSDVGIGPYILCFYKPQNIIYTYYNIPPGKIQERRSRGCPAVPPLVFGLYSAVGAAGAASSAGVSFFGTSILPNLGKSARSALGAAAGLLPAERLPPRRPPRPPRL